MIRTSAEKVNIFFMAIISMKKARSRQKFDEELLKNNYLGTVVHSCQNRYDNFIVDNRPLKKQIVYLCGIPTGIYANHNVEL
jgi:hypothetical protein